MAGTASAAVKRLPEPLALHEPALPEVPMTIMAVLEVMEEHLNDLMK